MRLAALVFVASPIALVLSVPATARAEAPSLDLRGWHASPDAEAGMTLEPASAPDTWEWNTGLRLNWAYRPIELTTSGSDEVVPIEHQVTADFVFGIGIARRVLLGLDLPYVLAQTGDDVTDPGLRDALAGSTGAPLVALGDLGLSAKIVVMPPDEPEFGGFGIAAIQRFSLPTGDEGGWIGEGSSTSESRLLFEWRSAPLSALLSGGIKFRFEKETFLCYGATTQADTGCPAQFGHELPLAAGVAVRPSGLGIDDGERTTFHGELRTYLPLSPNGPLVREEPAGAFGSLAARVRARDVSFFGGVEVAFTDGVGNAPVRASLGVDFAPRDHDQDDDGLEDEIDQCRELPEDLDGFEDDDGCPEVDDDQDQVPDAEDLCPRAAEDRDGFEDGDGCPDADDDRDGVPDALDRCPTVPAPGMPDGCQLADPDGDGLVGGVDRCPTEAEDKDGFQDEDGCPDRDDDADGIADPEDACPREAGPQSADPKLRGCANPDPDGDTFADAADKCPSEAETFDGKTDEDGCPEPAPAQGPAPKPLVELVTKNDAQVLTPNGTLAFGKDDEVDAPSALLLRAVAQIAKKTPGSRILVGARPSPARKDQAQKRAFAVAQALRGYVGRDDAVQVVDWDQVKGAPRAEIYGVGLVLTK
jgi:OOP family OmpA-OmpF porin